MGYSVSIEADSIYRGVRLVTFRATFPRCILAEANTHRVLSRSSASSRAVPIDTVIASITSDPFIPVWWGAAQGGMVADAEVSPDAQLRSRDKWLMARDAAIASVRNLMQDGLHKQIPNRILEPWMYHTALITGTEWSNFFALRRHKAAMPEMRKLARMMWTAFSEHTPDALEPGDWHLPLVTEEERMLGRYSPRALAQASAGRCRRVSTGRLDVQKTFEEDVAACNQCVTMGHMSPLEHQAQAPHAGAGPHGAYERYGHLWWGNLRGWIQHRSFVPNENDFSHYAKEEDYA